jgi:hypothetical protein
MSEFLQPNPGNISQQDFSVIQGAISAIKLLIDDKRVQTTDIAADVGSAYQRFAKGSATDVEAAVKAVTKAKDDFNSRVSAWQRELRTALACAPKSLKKKLEGQLQLGTGRAHNLLNSLESLIGKLAEFNSFVEEIPRQAGQPAEITRSEEDSARENAPHDAGHLPQEGIHALRNVLSENGLVLADVLTDRPTKPGEPGARLIVYRVNNITSPGNVIRDDREPRWMPTEYGEIRKPIIGSIPFSVGGAIGTVAGDYKINHIEVRASFRSDKVLKHKITLNHQLREGNILYAYLAKREVESPRLA